jgi:hypothetical protein
VQGADYDAFPPAGAGGLQVAGFIFQNLVIVLRAATGVKAEASFFDFFASNMLQ